MSFVTVLAVASVITAFCFIWRWLQAEKPIEAQARLLVEELDAGYDDPGRYSTPLQREVAWMFKEKFGEVSNSKANRILAGEFVREHFLAKTDMRTVDRVRMAPLAIELCVTPVRDAVRAVELGTTDTLAARRKAVNYTR